MSIPKPFSRILSYFSCLRNICVFFFSFIYYMRMTVGLVLVSNILIWFQGLNVETQVERKITMSKTSFSYVISGFYSDSKQAKREAIAKISVNPKSFVALVSGTALLCYQQLLTTSQFNFLNSFSNLLVFFWLGWLEDHHVKQYPLAVLQR